MKTSRVIAEDLPGCLLVQYALVSDLLNSSDISILELHQSWIPRNPQQQPPVDLTSTEKTKASSFDTFSSSHLLGRQSNVDEEKEAGIYQCTPTSPVNSQVLQQYTCHFCPKLYYSMATLRLHMKTHTLPCKCLICGKAFSRMWLLNGHIRTHTGEKSFRCRVCQRAFADRSNLRSHMQTHVDVKKYPCGGCGQTFSRMNLLIKHRAAVSGGRCQNGDIIDSPSQSLANAPTS